MKKVLLEFGITLLIFVSIWFGLSEINWISLFNIDQLDQKTEKKLGDLTWEYYSDSDNEILDEKILKTVDSLVYHLNKANNFDHQYIKLHIVQNDEVNAFALPNGHLVINSQLIIDAKNQDEVLGVIAHELAHIHLNHINKKLAKEFGIAIVVNAIAGNNSEVLAEISQTIASNAFSRQDEREADLEAITYLERAQISPKALADFLYQDIEEQSKIDSKLTDWLSTHPNSKERSEYILERISFKELKSVEVIHSTTWNELKNELKN